MTQHALLVVPMCPNQIEGKFAVSMHDLRVYLNINKKTTLVCLHDENTYVKCLPTSLLDRFVK